MTNVASQIDLHPVPIRSLQPAREGLPDLKPLSIGRVGIGFPVVQAALSGYSDGPMRIVARRLGAPYTVSEVKF
ncbi:MAG: tRNA-dihydrouridine synthase family protein, partial [Planctomycetia bacterium]|nr:tRNA-dihydrouridine synthase family protein [Planctomycetia bacterium]